VSSLCARFSFLSLCEIFYVNLFGVQKSMHDFFWHQHKMIILRTTQNWWKRPYIASGWALDTLKKVVEHCCRNCRFLGGDFGRYGLWLTIVTSLSQGAHPSPTPNNGDFPYLNQVSLSFLCPIPARIRVSGRYIDLLVICCTFLFLREKPHLKSDTTLPSWIFQNPNFGGL